MLNKILAQMQIKYGPPTDFINPVMYGPPYNLQPEYGVYRTPTIVDKFLQLIGPVTAVIILLLELIFVWVGVFVYLKRKSEQRQIRLILIPLLVLIVTVIILFFKFLFLDGVV